MRSTREIIGLVWMASAAAVGCSAGETQPLDVVMGHGQDASPGDAVGLDVSVADNDAADTNLAEGGYDVVLEAAESSCSDAPLAAVKALAGLCATPPTDNECDGTHDPPDLWGNTQPNGLTGNGFDDDCDGLVDEGCACDGLHAVGTVKDCYLLPSSWTDPETGLPVGWCAQNSKGTLRCVSKGGSPEFPVKQWDGVCRGARAPFSDDACAPGDFNCDGVPMNPSGRDCACGIDPVHCPDQPILMSPYPNPNDLTQKDSENPLADPTHAFIIDGLAWIDDPYKQQAKNWSWEVTGGDCDNVLPHPTFALYNQPKAAAANQIGKEVKALGPSHTERGFVTAPDDSLHQIYPAFSLSGDYVVRSRFIVAKKLFECDIKVQVRAPGIRAELCWDNVGHDPEPGGNDTDLHLARLQGNESCTQHGWFLPCGSAPNADDCYYDDSSGCGRRGLQSPGWGYPDSHSAACHGWGSLRASASSCTNPRLDRDNIFCTIGEKDPNAPMPGPNLGFCGPENINLDNPNAGERFAVGIHCYSCVSATHPATHPHVNLYCNGQRVFSAGFDPRITTPQFPVLDLSTGGPQGGSFWTTAILEWKGSSNNPCAVVPVPSKVPNASTDGTSAYCVEEGPQNKGSSPQPGADGGLPDIPWLFTSGGTIPSGPAQACWH
jgi:hypothetical protein